MFFLKHTHWQTLQRWSPTLLYIAGIIKIYFLLQNVDALRLSAINPYIIFLASVSNVLAITGVLGLYPQLSNRTSRLPRLGAVFLAIAALLLVIQAAFGQLQRFIFSRSLYDSLKPLFLAKHYLLNISMFGGYILFGIGALRTNYYPNLLGYLLFVIPIWTISHFLIIETQYLENTWLFSTVMGSIQALTYLGMGYILSTPANIINASIVSFWTWVREAR